ncbi:hypothetical protein ROG8370_00218 [Roseovarius gaetbuli]|uniref:Uncharacterized protein n=2 Tax=Roseovarius gaetbuli TaxID=1356575 RepID=A0A1X6Y618_9RHOB|nr:hypothetical protein ROG8370_00218 [Roseovarius gaetbuli]
MCFCLPANYRIMALENSHRRISPGMQDVARAHAADRTGVFQLSSEFDAERERLAYLRDGCQSWGLKRCGAPTVG